MTLHEQAQALVPKLTLQRACELIDDCCNFDEIKIIEDCLSFHIENYTQNDLEFIYEHIDGRKFWLKSYKVN